MAKENEERTSALTYPNWSRVGKKEPERAGSLRVLPNGDVARDHHIMDDDEALPEIVETPEEKKAHKAEIKAIQAEQYQEGFESFAKDTQSEHFGLGWKIFFAAVIALTIACAVFSKLV